MSDLYDGVDGAVMSALLRAVAEQAFTGAFVEAQAEVDRILLYGNGHGEPRGVLNREEREPTPLERAFAILGPELRRCPLYNAGPAAIYSHTWKEQP